MSAGSGRLVTRKPGYLLDVRTEEVDTLRFGRLVAEAVLLKEALDLAVDTGALDAAALARGGLALAARRQGDYERARELYLGALSFYQETPPTPNGRPDEVPVALGAQDFAELKEQGRRMSAREAANYPAAGG